MKLTTRVGLALLLVAGASVVVGAGSFTSTEADRTLDVSVVEDENAYIGFQKTNGEWSEAEDHDYEVTLDPNDDEQTYDEGSAFLEVDLLGIGAQLFAADNNAYVYDNVVSITNQFDERLQTDIYVELSEEETGESRSNTTKMSLGVGESASLDLACPAEGTSIWDAIEGASGENNTQGQPYNKYYMDIGVTGNTESGNFGTFNRTVEVVCSKHEG